jgi:rhomboid protease GluP
VTNFLIAINVLIFIAEIFWRSSPSYSRGISFIELGGLFAPLVVSGQWWRIITANFIHLGFLHLFMNMFGLMYLGKFVEDSLGTFKFTLLYVISGLGSMVVITFVDLQSLKPPVTVGASGAIMGLLGVMGAIHLLGWQKGKSQSAAREFRVVLFSVGFQFAFDLVNGHTSIVGHLSGAVVGFLVGLILLVLLPPNPQSIDD